MGWRAGASWVFCLARNMDSRATWASDWHAIWNLVPLGILIITPLTIFLPIHHPNCHPPPHFPKSSPPSPFNDNFP